MWRFLHAVTGAIVAGRRSGLSLAALAIGSAAFITVLISLTSLATALLPAWAEMHGARQPERVGPSVRQALYVCAAASLAVLPHPEPILRATEVPLGMLPVAASM